MPSFIPIGRSAKRRHYECPAAPSCWPLPLPTRCAAAGLKNACTILTFCLLSLPLTQQRTQTVNKQKMPTAEQFLCWSADCVCYCVSDGVGKQLTNVVSSQVIGLVFWLNSCSRTCTYSCTLAGAVSIAMSR